MARPVINPGAVVWSGEHWVSALREPGGDSDSAMVSLYRTSYSPAGDGAVAFIEIRGAPGFPLVCGASEELARFHEARVRRLGGRLDRDLPYLEAAIGRGGDIRATPSWVIETARGRVEVSWGQLHPPLIVQGFSPTFSETADYFTLLCFAEESAIRLDGREIAGRPYPIDAWRRSIGGDHSSCVVALGETMVEVPR